MASEASLKKRILFLVQLPPPVHGMSVMNSYIVSSSKILSSFSSKYINTSTSREIADLRGGSYSKLFRSFPIYFELLRRIICDRSDIIYITPAPYGLGFYKDSILILLSRLSSAKVILHLHGKGIEREIEANGIKRLYYRFVFKNCFIIHLSKVLLPDLKSLNLRIPPLIVANAVEDSFRPIGHEESTFRVLFLSHLMREKGITQLIKAIPLIRSSDRPIKFIFIGTWGDEETRKECEYLIKTNNLERIVEFPGAQFGPSKFAWMQKSDIFVLPTMFRNECFPVAILEALCNCLPVISSFEGAIPEIVVHDKNGFLINPSNPVEIAEKIELLYSNRTLLNEMRANARHEYLRRFTLENFEVNITKAISSVADNDR